ncbi:methionine ABC transporter ATP-binding protein [Devriesea agamarum]|uniref:methionine ABC transporter ATP-binding protein n=1 Tax=Devriesea agamarum TaxID=472569 RepID=UPI00071DE095|nr:methionine ABC transporter ATP-binding protein [Devriesea agamarum]
MITLDGLTKVFPAPDGGEDVVALDGIDLSVPAGSIHGIVGRSGAGKSTLIRCLTALERPTEGSVYVDDVNLTALVGAALRRARRDIGMVFQHANLLDSRTAARNIAHPLEIAGTPRGEREHRVAELVDLVGLTGRENNYPSQLSGGQRQRVGIARALATSPRLLLCDEPTSALDSTTTRQILRLIRDLRDRLGITVLIITHEMSVVREVCDGATLLESGRIVETGSLQDVVRNPHGRLAPELIPMPPAPTGVDGLLINVFYGASERLKSTDDVIAFVRARGAEVQIAAGTIETIGGTQIGRVQLALTNASGTPISEHGLAECLRDLEAEGIAAEKVER